jgi:hypothetical protein
LEVMWQEVMVDQSKTLMQYFYKWLRKAIENPVKFSRHGLHCLLRNRAISLSYFQNYTDYECVSSLKLHDWTHTHHRVLPHDGAKGPVL